MPKEKTNTSKKTADDPQEVTFMYERAEGHRIVPANGVFGGVTTQGDFRMEFYVESRQLPTELRQTLLPEGRLGEVVQQSPKELKVVRQLQVGVLMSSDQARNLASWITTTLAKAEETERRQREAKNANSIRS